MQITQEYLNEQLQNLNAVIDDRFERQTQILMTHADEQVEMLARIVNEGFEGERAYLEEKPDVRDKVKQLEADVRRIKDALRIQ